MQEVDELCAEWQPEPLEGPVLPMGRTHLQPPVLSSDVGPYVIADGRRVLNLATTNFLGIAGDPAIRVGRTFAFPSSNASSVFQCQTNENPLQ